MLAADLKATYFKGQMQEFVEEWLERNNLSKLKSVFEGIFQNFQRMWV